jgi:glycosyltransferase involved in cell wall biosynthesis
MISVGELKQKLWERIIGKIIGKQFGYSCSARRTCRNLISQTGDISEYDYIHAENHEGAYLAIQFKRKLRIPIIFDMHGLAVEEAKLRGDSPREINFIEWLERRTVHEADRICVVSDFMKDYLERIYGFPKTQVFKIYCGAKIFPYLKYDRFVENRINVVYAGGAAYYENVKDFFNLPEAFYRKFPTLNHKVFFYHIGHDLRSIYPEQYKRIEYLGKRSWEETLNLLNTMHVGIAPSTTGPERLAASPVKVADYASCGNPIITCRAGEWSDNIGRYDAGVVCEKSDPELFAEALAQLCNRESWDRKSKNAVKMIEELYDWDRILSVFKNIYY